MIAYINSNIFSVKLIQFIYAHNLRDIVKRKKSEHFQGICLHARYCEAIAREVNNGIQKHVIAGGNGEERPCKRVSP